VGRGWVIRSDAPAVWPTGGSGSGSEWCCSDDGEQAAASRETASCSERQGEWSEGSAGLSLFLINYITINI